MKRTTILFLTIALAAMMCFCGPAWAEQYSIKIGGGPTGGTFNTFASDMAVYLAKADPDLKASAVGSGGSVANVRRINSKEFDFGLSLRRRPVAGLHRQAAQGPDQIRPWSESWATSTAPRPSWWYGPTARRPPPLTSRACGWRWATPVPGPRASCERFFRHIGLWEGTKRQFLGYFKASQSFLDRKIDAFWLLVGFPNRSVIEANSRAKIRLVNVGQEAEATGFYKAMPFYQPVEIPAGAYQDVPACQTFQEATFLTAKADLPDELVYRVMTVLWSEQGLKEMATRKETFKSMSLENNFKGALCAPTSRGGQVLGGKRGKGSGLPETVIRISGGGGAGFRPKKERGWRGVVSLTLGSRIWK